jgi:replicative DNA helicase
MQKPSTVDRAKPDPLTAKPKQPDRPTAGDDVSPESNDWLDYLEDLSSKQGKRLMSGFAGLDDKWGGLRLGLMLIADEDQNRARDFLKQLTDQIARHSEASCLYVSFDLSKEALRLRTLSRLAGVSAEDMENGRFEKDSPEWRKVLSAGREAMEWLERVYVAEAGSDLSSSSVRDLSQRILGTEKGSMGLVALDSFKRLGGQKDSVQTMAELKELAESQSLLVLTAAEDFTLLSRANADLSVRLSGNSTEVELELTQSTPAKSLALRFQYHPETHRFTEKND